MFIRKFVNVKQTNNKRGVGPILEAELVDGSQSFPHFLLGSAYGYNLNRNGSVRLVPREGDKELFGEPGRAYWTYDKEANLTGILRMDADDIWDYYVVNPDGECLINLVDYRKRQIEAWYVLTRTPEELAMAEADERDLAELAVLEFLRMEVKPERSERTVTLTRTASPAWEDLMDRRRVHFVIPDLKIQNS